MDYRIVYHEHIVHDHSYCESYQSNTMIPKSVENQALETNSQNNQHEIPMVSNGNDNDSVATKSYTGYEIDKINQNPLYNVIGHKTKRESGVDGCALQLSDNDTSVATLPKTSDDTCISLENASVARPDANVNEIGLRIIRKEKKVKTVKAKNHKCLICEKSFGAAYRLKDHMIGHSEVKAYSCDICQTSFKRRHHLTRHKEIHSKERKDIKTPSHLKKDTMRSKRCYICSICSDVFKSKKHFTMHKLEHAEFNPDHFEQVLEINNKKENMCKKESDSECYRYPSFSSENQLSEKTHMKLSKNVCSALDNAASKMQIPKKQIRRIKTLKRIEEKKHICLVCEKKFSRKSHLNDHLLLHTGIKTFHCEVCGKSFRQKSHLKRHTLTHSVKVTINVYFCDTCQEGFSDFFVFRNHLVHHVGQDRKLRCGICNETFDRAMKLKDHMKIVHSMNANVPCRKILTLPTGEVDQLSSKDTLTEQQFSHDVKQQKFTCKCGKQYSRKYHLNRHAKSHFEQKETFKCTKCGKELSQKDKLTRHSRICRAHPPSDKKISVKINEVGHEKGNEVMRENSSVNIVIDRKLSMNKGKNIQQKQVKLDCPICDKQFSCAYTLKDHHFRFHTPASSQHQCDICLKKFTTVSKLESHELMHKDGKMYQCNRCELRFFTYAECKEHKIEHVNERSFVCSLCPWTFQSSASLENHILIHKESKPHLCDTCNKSYRLKCDLQRHVNVHFESVVWKCTVCCKQFYYKSTWKSHQSVHTTEKQYFCDKCGASFRQRNVLLRHMSLHKGNKSHMCEKCGWQFARVEHLQNHMRTHLKEELASVLSA